MTVMVMADASRALIFGDDLADFVSELRSRVFSSKLDSARYFNLARPTVSRYESGQINAPLGYLISLAELYIQQLQAQGEAIAAPQQNLLQEINKTVRWYYRGKKPFHNWEELSREAAAYLEERQKSSAAATESRLSISGTHKEDWGEAIDVSVFYGREEELNRLSEWVVTERCRLVALLGLGGMGKTTLSIKLIEQAKSEFDFIFWRSLRNAPQPEDILADCLKFLAGTPDLALPEGVSQRISLLIDYLRKSRCLLVLDNLESILEAGQPQSVYRKGYEGYGELIGRIGGSAHQSCLLLTSREKPAELEVLEGKTSPVRALPIEGLIGEASRQILEDKGVFGPAEAFANLTGLYLGNPLALKLISGVILELFGGDVQEFLKEGQVIFGGISRLLDQQFERLSALEQTVMYWLAIGREYISPGELQADIFPPVSRKALLEALKALRERALIERSEAGVAFSQQPVVMEYVTERLIELVSAELEQGEVSLLTKYALVKAQDKDYVRQTQVRLLLSPVLTRLLDFFKSEAALTQHLKELLDRLRALPRPLSQGYGGGNLANLLYQLTGNLRGYDFSDLNIWQAYLQGVELEDSSFARANLTRSVFTETFDAVYTIAFSPDGKLLAAGSSNGEIRLWQMGEYPQVAKLLLSWKGHTGSVQSVNFSPDGNLLATGGNDQIVQLWEVSSGRNLKTLKGHTGWVWAVVFSSDGKLVASSGADRTIRLWDMVSGQCVRNLDEHTNSVRTIAISPDGTRLASGSGDRTVKIWDITCGRCLNTLEGHTGWVQSVAFSPDNRLLASAGEDGTIHLWDSVTGASLKTMQGYHEWVWNLAFSPDGKILASSSDEQVVRLWEVDSGQCSSTLEGHTAPIRAVTFSPDGEIIASSSGDRSIKLWEARTRRCIKTLHGHSNPVRSVAFSPDGEFLASSSGDRNVRLWDINRAQCVKILPGYHESIWSVAFSPDGKSLATASDERTARLWDIESGECLQTLSDHSEWVLSVAYSPTGRLVATGSGDRTVKLWDSQTGQLIKTLEGHAEWVWVVAFSPDGKLVISGSNDCSLKIWDIESGQCLQTLPQSYGVLAMALSQDGKFIATGAGENHTISILGVSSGKPLKTLEGHNRLIWAMAFSPDGKLLASGSEDGTVKLWEVSTGQCLKTLYGHAEWIRASAFSPDGKLLATGSEDGTIRLWHIPSGESQSILRTDRPYERLNISGVTGLNEAQKANLRTLGATQA